MRLNFLNQMKTLGFIAALYPVAAWADAVSGLTPPPPRVGVLIEKILDHGHVIASGSGVLLSDQLILTAAHVVSREPQNPFVTVILDGWRVSGMVIASGQSRKLDLALIKIDPTAMPSHRVISSKLAICSNNPPPNQAVVVVSKGMTTRSSTMPFDDAGRVKDWTNVLSTGYHPGNSGGGVFNPALGCLWGILNIEASGTINGRFMDLTYFVPASQISAFVSEYTAH